MSIVFGLKENYTSTVEDASAASIAEVLPNAIRCSCGKDGAKVCLG